LLLGRINYGDTTTSTAALALAPAAVATIVERTTVPLGGRLVASTNAAKLTVALPPGQ